MKIPLTGGGFTIIDDEDYHKLCSPKGRLYKWQNFKPTSRHYTSYASRMTLREDGTWKKLLLHRVILGCPDDMLIDHINRNGLDNRKENLRVVTRFENALNIKKHNTSNRYKGVFRDNINSKTWVVKFRGERIGSFKSDTEGAMVYDEYVRSRYGEFVTTNKSLGLL